MMGAMPYQQINAISTAELRYNGCYFGRALWRLFCRWVWAKITKGSE